MEAAMFLLKFLSVKGIILIGTVGVVVIAGAALYVASVAGANIPVLDSAFRVDPEPPSPEVIARADKVEEDIRVAIEDKSAFFLQLTDQNLSDLLVSNIDTEGRIQNLDVEIREEDVKVSGELAGRVGVGFSGILGITLENGEVKLELKSVKLSSLPTPGFVRDEVQPFIDDVLDINERLRESGATQIQAVVLVPGTITIVGVQAEGATVAESTLAALQGGSTGGTPPVAPGANIVPPGRTGGEPGSPIYIALGDSLSANVGVSDPKLGYVSRFHRYLESERSQTLGLLDLGVSGESSISIVNEGQLGRALNAIQAANGNVAALTIDLGANDLLAHLGSDDCTSGPRGTACQARVSAALGSFETNFAVILGQLKSALPADAEFYVMTIYNPFDFGIGLPIEEFSSEIVAQLNEIISTAATAVGAKVADPFDDMADNAGAWTNMLGGSADIHPNAEGYQVLALSLAEAREQ
jgi:lysophospholipase L1-like esterase